jgi:hypothetical protein
VCATTQCKKQAQHLKLQYETPQFLQLVALALLCDLSSLNMARKKAHTQQKAVLPAAPAPSLNELLQRATETGEAEHVQAYLDAGGSPTMMVEISEDGVDAPMVPLLHAVCLFDHEQHTDVASSVNTLVSAGADVNSTCINPGGNSRTALMWACEITGGSTAPMKALLTQAWPPQQMARLRS